MADTSTSEPAPHTNGLVDAAEDDERGKQRPADIDADMREMERRKRVELIMNSRLFREELERIIETQIKDGGAGTSHLLQQISDMMGVPKHANVFKGPNCVVPINDIRGVESMGYAKGEKLLRCKLACVYRLLDLYGWSKGVSNQVTARLNQDQEHFLVNPYGMLCHEITASSLVKIDMQGNVVEQGTTNFGVNLNAFSLHAAIHAARPDVKCAVHVHTPAVMAVSALKCGLLPISQESVVVGEVSTHPYSGGLAEPEEREKVARNLGPINKILLLANHGAVCCGETIEEAFFNIHNLILACETQLKLMPVGIDNLVLVSEETRKQMYEAARRAPDGTASRTGPPEGSVIAEKLAERKWRVGGTDFEALMRMLDNAGFRTGYIYRHPLIKGEPPRPRNDCEVPPAVSSLGYLLEEEEMYKQGIWKHGRKGNDRTRWLNSPNVYQKVEILETGTPDPKKITKWVDANADEWVADGSPTHSSTPVKIDAALQFVPKNTNPKEFKKLQQQIKDNRRADKISAGPQSHILEGVTWEEAKKMQDAGVTQTGDQVVVVGAASKGIIQRGFQHHAMVYKAPYAKNPFDSVTDEELDEYKKVIEKKAKGEYDTDFSESEGLSSAQISKQVDELNLRSPTSATSETEEESRDEPRVLRIETKHAPKPSQPEVVLSDDDEHASALLLNSERSHQQATANFNQSYKGLKNGAGLPAFYRTCSHAGMPKGSFISPQPKHYHVQGGFSLAEMRAHPLFQRKMQQNKPQISLTSNTNIDVNINPSPKPLSINLPLNTIKEFITPFNRALGLETNRADKIFEKVQNYIETDSENLYEYDFTERSNDRSVLRKQRDMVMRDINSNVALLELDSSFSDVEVVENEISDHENPNTETEVIDFAKKITKYNFENTSSTAIPTVSIWDEICKHPTVISKYTENLQDIFALPKTPEEPNDSDEYTEFKLPSPDRQQEMVTLENESINASGDSILKCVLEISKGTILDSANTCEKFDEIWPDKNCVSVIKQISRLIYKFIMQVCVETLEALEFPDIRCYHDAEDFFDSILVIFEKYLDLFPEDEDFKKLKQCVMNSVIRCMEKYFVIIPVTKDNLIDKKIANKKVFALKKFLSVLIYILFDKIENPDYQCTHYDMPDLNINEDDIKYHSTPDSCDLYYTLSESSGGGDNSSSSQESKNEASEITSFLTQKSEKSGNSSYWFMLNDKVSPLKRCSSMINSKSPPEVAEKMRRLSAPARMSYDIPRALSPIPEEPRKSLLIELSEDEYSFNSETFILSGSENSLAETEYQTVQEQTPSPTENPFPTENHKVVFQNQVTFVIKPNIKTDYEAARSETSLTFVPDDNITAQLQALSLESDFDTNSYISAQSLTEDEGDWMGLASAQF